MTAIDRKARIRGIANRLRRLAAGLTYGPQYDESGAETAAGQVEAEIKFRLIELADKADRVYGMQGLPAASDRGRVVP